MIGKLSLAIGLTLLCVACTPVKPGDRTPPPPATPASPAPPAPPVPTAPPAPKAKAADPAAMTYRSIWRESGQVTLVKGVYRAPVAPGSAAELIVRLTGSQAFGKIDGKDVGAVVLITQAGGSGSFFDLALLTRKTDDWVNSDVMPLGDRVDIQALVLRDNQVVVTMITHGPNDLMCCPTLRVERRFKVQDGKLVAVGEPAVAPAPAALND